MATLTGKFLGTIAPQECMAGTRSVLCNEIPCKGEGWLLCTNMELRDSKVVTMCWRAPQDANPSSISHPRVCVFFFPSYVPPGFWGRSTGANLGHCWLQTPGCQAKGEATRGTLEWGVKFRRQKWFQYSMRFSSGTPPDARNKAFF